MTHFFICVKLKNIKKPPCVVAQGDPKELPYGEYVADEKANTRFRLRGRNDIKMVTKLTLCSPPREGELEGVIVTLIII